MRIPKIDWDELKKIRNTIERERMARFQREYTGFYIKVLKAYHNISFQSEMISEHIDDSRKITLLDNFLGNIEILKKRGFIFTENEITEMWEICLRSRCPDILLIIK